VSLLAEKAYLLIESGDLAGSNKLLRKALNISEAAGDDLCQANALASLVENTLVANDVNQTFIYINKSHKLLKGEYSSSRHFVDILNVLDNVHRQYEEPNVALTYF